MATKAKEEKKINARHGVVSITEFQNILGFIADAKVQNRIDIKKGNAIDIMHLPLMVWGEAGVGKTQVSREFIKEKGFEVVTLNLANQTPEELLGQPDGKGGYYPLNWILNTDKPVAYQLDEINRAPKHTLQCIFNFILEGTIHHHKIDLTKDMVICCANVDTEDYYITSFEDRAFLSRFCHLFLEPTHDQVMNYFEKKGYNKKILSKLREHRDFIDITIPDEAFENKLVENYRILEKVLLAAEYMTQDVYEKHGASIISAMLTPEKFQILDTILKDKFQKTINLEDVLKCKTKEQVEEVVDIDEVSEVQFVMSIICKWLEDENAFNDPKLKHKKIVKLLLETFPKDSGYSFISKMTEMTEHTTNVQMLVGTDFHAEYIYRTMEIEAAGEKAKEKSQDESDDCETDSDG